MASPRASASSYAIKSAENEVLTHALRRHYSVFLPSDLHRKQEQAPSEQRALQRDVERKLEYLEKRLATSKSLDAIQDRVRAVLTSLDENDGDYSDERAPPLSEDDRLHLRKWEARDLHGFVEDAFEHVDASRSSQQQLLASALQGTQSDTSEAIRLASHAQERGDDDFPTSPAEGNRGPSLEVDGETVSMLADRERASMERVHFLQSIGARTRSKVNHLQQHIHRLEEERKDLMLIQENASALQAQCRETERSVIAAERAGILKAEQSVALERALQRRLVEIASLRAELQRQVQHSQQNRDSLRTEIQELLSKSERGASSATKERPPEESAPEERTDSEIALRHAEIEITELKARLQRMTKVNEALSADIAHLRAGAIAEHIGDGDRRAAADELIASHALELENERQRARHEHEMMRSQLVAQLDSQHKAQLSQYKSDILSLKDDLIVRERELAEMRSILHSNGVRTASHEGKPCEEARQDVTVTAEAEDRPRHASAQTSSETYTDTEDSEEVIALRNAIDALNKRVALLESENGELASALAAKSQELVQTLSQGPPVYIDHVAMQRNTSEDKGIQVPFGENGTSLCAPSPVQTEPAAPPNSGTRTTEVRDIRSGPDRKPVDSGTRIASTQTQPSEEASSGPSLTEHETLLAEANARISHLEHALNSARDETRSAAEELARATQAADIAVAERVRAQLEHSKTNSELAAHQVNDDEPVLSGGENNAAGSEEIRALRAELERESARSKALQQDVVALQDRLATALAGPPHDPDYPQNTADATEDARIKYNHQQDILLEKARKRWSEEKLDIVIGYRDKLTRMEEEHAARLSKLQRKLSAAREAIHRAAANPLPSSTEVPDTDLRGYLDEIIQVITHIRNEASGSAIREAEATITKDILIPVLGLANTVYRFAVHALNDPESALRTHLVEEGLHIQGMNREATLVALHLTNENLAPEEVAAHCGALLDRTSHTIARIAHERRTELIRVMRERNDAAAAHKASEDASRTRASVDATIIAQLRSEIKLMQHSLHEATSRAAPLLAGQPRQARASKERPAMQKESLLSSENIFGAVKSTDCDELLSLRADSDEDRSTRAQHVSSPQAPPEREAVAGATWLDVQRPRTSPAAVSARSSDDQARRESPHNFRHPAAASRSASSRAIARTIMPRRKVHGATGEMGNEEQHTSIPSAIVERARYIWQQENRAARRACIRSWSAQLQQNKLVQHVDAIRLRPDLRAEDVARAQRLAELFAKFCAWERAAASSKLDALNSAPWRIIQGLVASIRHPHIHDQYKIFQERHVAYVIEDGRTATKDVLPSLRRTAESSGRVSLDQPAQRARSFPHDDTDSRHEQTTESLPQRQPSAQGLRSTTTKERVPVDETGSAWNKRRLSPTPLQQRRQRSLPGPTAPGNTQASTRPRSRAGDIESLHQSFDIRGASSNTPKLQSENGNGDEQTKKATATRQRSLAKTPTRLATPQRLASRSTIKRSTDSTFFQKDEISSWVDGEPSQEALSASYTSARALPVGAQASLRRHPDGNDDPAQFLFRVASCHNAECDKSANRPASIESPEETRQRRENYPVHSEGTGVQRNTDSDAAFGADTPLTFHPPGSDQTDFALSPDGLGVPKVSRNTSKTNAAWKETLLRRGRAFRRVPLGKSSPAP